MLNSKSKTVVHLLSSATLLLTMTACDQNTVKTADKDIILKAKCKSAKSFDLNKIQNERVMKFGHAEDVVVRTIIARDEASGEAQRLGEGQVFKQKTATEFINSDEMMLLKKDCETLTATYRGVGAPEGVVAKIKNITEDSIDLEQNNKVEQKSKKIAVADTRTISIEKIKADKKDAVALGNEAQGFNSVRIKIEEKGSVQRKFEALQFVELKDRGHDVEVSKSTIDTISEVLGEEIPSEVVETLSRQDLNKSTIKINSKILASAMDKTAARLSMSTAARGQAVNSAADIEIDEVQQILDQAEVELQNLTDKIQKEEAASVDASEIREESEVSSEVEVEAKKEAQESATAAAVTTDADILIDPLFDDEL